MKPSLLFALSALVLCSPAVQAAATPTPTSVGSSTVKPIVVPSLGTLPPPGPITPRPTPTPGPRLSSEESVRTLLEVTKAHLIVERMASQIDPYAAQYAMTLTKDKKLTEAQQKAFDAERTKRIAALKADAAWTRLQQAFVDAYTRTFTQEEIDAITVFYRSPAGQALLTKLSGAMSQAMNGIQAMTGSMPQRIMQETQSALKAAQDANPGPVPTPTLTPPAAGPASK